MAVEYIVRSSGAGAGSGNVYATLTAAYNAIVAIDPNFDVASSNYGENFIYAEQDDATPFAPMNVSGGGGSAHVDGNITVVFKRVAAFTPTLAEIAATTSSTITLSRPYLKMRGENGAKDLRIQLDAGTQTRTPISMSGLGSGLRNFHIVDWTPGGRPELGGVYQIDAGSISNGVLVGLKQAATGGYRKGNSNVCTIDHMTFIDCTYVRAGGGGNTLLTNSLVFGTSMYSEDFDPASDYNGISGASIPGSTGVNNQFNLLASDVFVDPAADFTLKAGAPVIGAALDGSDLGAIWDLGAAPATISMIAPASLTRGTDIIGLVISDASADGLVIGDFSLTFGGVSLTLSNLASTGANAYTLDAAVPLTVPLQHGVDLYDLVLTENAVATTAAALTFAEPADQDFTDLADGLTPAEQWVSGSDYPDTAEVYHLGFKFTRGVGDPITNSTIEPVEGGVDGWIDGGPSILLYSGGSGTYTDGTQAVYDALTSTGGAVNVLADATFTVDPAVTVDQTFDTYLIAPDGTIGPTMTVTLLAPVAGNAAPIITGATSVDVVEGNAANVSVNISNLDGQTPTLSGADAGLFTAPTNPSGDLWVTTLAAKVYDTPLDANVDNVYEVTFVADDTVNAAVNYPVGVNVLELITPVVDLSTLDPLRENDASGVLFASISDLRITVQDVAGAVLYFSAVAATNGSGRLSAVPVPSMSVGDTVWVSGARTSSGVGFGPIQMLVTNGSAP